jgi:hypothetical protein
VVGETTSSYALTGLAYQDNNAGGTEAFVAKLNATGTSFTYQSYLGGSGNDVAYAVEVNASKRRKRLSDAVFRCSRGRA